MSTHSFAKHQIHTLLLEGISPSAEQVFEAADYQSLQCLKEAYHNDLPIESPKDVRILGIRSRTQVNEALLEKLPRLLAVGCFCIGTNQVDHEQLALAGIPVFNAPFANTRSVAELVLAEMILLMRQVPEKSMRAHEGQWLKSATGAYEVRGKTLGIIGYGHIGAQLSVLAESLGMRVIFHDIEKKLPLGNAAQCESLQALFGQADMVSLHVPETPLTHHMIDARAISAMKKGVVLINASRGQVVDLEALRTALDTGHVLGAAIDVFPSEPKSVDEALDSPLQKARNTLLTPHIGGSTEEAQWNIGSEVAEKLVSYVDSGSTLSAVNFPEVALPPQAGKQRYIHIHKNEPGVLKDINSCFSEASVNVVGQYLQTSAAIGYVVVDVDPVRDPKALLSSLKVVPHTIKSRVLF